MGMLQIRNICMHAHIYGHMDTECTACKLYDLGDLGPVKLSQPSLLRRIVVRIKWEKKVSRSPLSKKTRSKWRERWGEMKKRQTEMTDKQMGR